MNAPRFTVSLTCILTLGVVMTGCANTDASMPIVFPADTWATSTPQAQGMDPALVGQAVKVVADVTGKDGVSQMLIIRNGYIVWRGPDVAKRHIVWSCTKSYMSTCFGLLWDDGLVQPGDLASKYWPAAAELYPTVTLEHLATFTSGYAHGEGGPLDLAKPKYAPGEAFEYSQQSDLLAAILARVAKRSLSDLFKERIGHKIGITADDMHWQSFGDVDGIAFNGGSGHPGGAVEINALAMARFGWLYCNNGVWNGQRLISQRYIDYATVPRTSPKTPPFDPKGWYVELPGNYGLNWWTNGPTPSGRPHWPHAPARMFAAQGNRDNVCFIIPDWHMVVVRMGNDDIIDMKLYDRMFELLGQSIGAEK